MIIVGAVCGAGGGKANTEGVPLAIGLKPLVPIIFPALSQM
jgi:hypothetical protein